MPKASRPASSRLDYVPALDGVRAICVLGVLCFHAGFDWARGGFLGVSTFFTLSGYLVTSIMFAEFDAKRAAGDVQPGIAVLDFFRRRLRRLVPASIVTLLLVVAIAPLWLGSAALARLGADVVASLLYVVNWRFLSGDYAYALIFSRPSLLQHYWSLAIEAQLYIVLPMIFVFVTRRRSPGVAFGAIVGVLIATATIAAYMLGVDPSWHDRIYYGTDMRASELLMGALLAAGLRSLPRGEALAPSRVVDVLSWSLLVAVLIAFSQIDLETPALHRGGFSGFALLSAGLIAACVRGRALAPVLAWRPLVWIGEVSYGVYLFHWPVYLALDAWLGDPAPWVTLVAGGGATLVLAALSHAMIETPIRRGRGWPGRRPFAALVAAIVVVTAFVGVRLQASAVIRELGGDAVRMAITAEPDGDASSIAFFGDSVAMTFSMAFYGWLDGRDDVRFAKGWTPLGCGLVMPDFLRRLQASGGNIRPFTGLRRDGFATRRECLEVPDRVREMLLAEDPDLAVSVSSIWDLLGVPVAKTRLVERVGKPDTDERLRQLMDQRVELLSSTGAEVVWLTLPRFERGANHPLRLVEIEAARARYNELVWELADRHPDQVHIVDFDRAFELWPSGALDPFLREDGIHITIDGGAALLDTGLGEDLLELAREAQWRRSRAGDSADDSVSARTLLRRRSEG